MRLSGLDWSIIAFYMGVSLVAGLWLAKRAGSGVGEFFLSGRKLSWWLAGTSMVATTFSCDTPLYITGLIRGAGIYENWQWWCFAISGMLAVTFFSRAWRKSGVVTDIELIGIRYSGPEASFLRGFKAIYFSTIIHTIIKAQVILAMAKILDITLGWGKWEGIIASSAITMAYATTSGLWGVVITDFLQFIIAMVGAVALAVVAVAHAGGVDAMRAALPADTLAFFPPAPPSGVDIMTTAMGAFLGYVGLAWWSKYSSDGGGVIVQRISSCRSEREGYAAAFSYNIANYAFRTWPWVLAALASLVIYPIVPGVKNDHEAVYVQMVVDFMPGGMRGLMVASFFAAFMSTLSTYLNLSSAYFVNDFYMPFVRPGRDERHYVRVSRITTLALSVVTAVITYYVTSIIGVFKFLIAFGSGTGLVYIVRWFWWRANAWSEISAMAASTVLTVVAYTAFIGWPYPQKLAFIISGSLAVWVTVTMLTRPVDHAKLVEFVRHVNPWGAGWARIRREAGITEAPEPIAGPLMEWAAGTALVLGLTIGIGKLVLHYYADAALWGALSAAAGVYLFVKIK